MRRSYNEIMMFSRKKSRPRGKTEGFGHGLLEVNNASPTAGMLWYSSVIPISLVRDNPPRFFIYIRASFCCCLCFHEKSRAFCHIQFGVQLLGYFSMYLTVRLRISCSPGLRTLFLSHTTSVVASWDSSVRSLVTFGDKV